MLGPSVDICCCYLVAKLCVALDDPMDCSPPGSSVHGIFQARVLEWGAIAFSDVQRSLAGYHPQGRKESDMTEVT